jgi:hypothetical protein
MVQHINQVIQKKNQIHMKKENHNNMISPIIINLMDRLLILVAIQRNHTIQQRVVNLNNYFAQQVNMILIQYIEKITNKRNYHNHALF